MVVITFMVFITFMGDTTPRVAWGAFFVPQNLFKELAGELAPRFLHFPKSYQERLPIPPRLIVRAAGRDSFIPLSPTVRTVHTDFSILPPSTLKKPAASSLCHFL